MVEIDSDVKRKPKIVVRRHDGNFIMAGTSQMPTMKVKAFRAKPHRAWPTAPASKPAKLSVPMPLFVKLTRAMRAAARRQRDHASIA